VVYKINTEKCLKCGVCVTQCPHGAFVVDEKYTEFDGLVLYRTRIDKDLCVECGECMDTLEWWCPAKAVYRE
jgi:ferredoxin